MADLRVEMSSDKDKIKKERTGTVGEESPGVSYGAVLVLLAGSAVLAAAVYYPNSLIVADLGKLIEKIENQTNPTGTPDFYLVRCPSISCILWTERFQLCNEWKKDKKNLDEELLRLSVEQIVL